MTNRGGGRRRFRWGDVGDVVNKYSGRNIKALRAHCDDLMNRWPDDDVLMRLRHGVRHVFSFHRHAFVLLFDVEACEWVLNLGVLPPRKHSGPSAPASWRGKRLRKPVPRGRGKRSARRPAGRRKPDARILFNWYKCVVRFAAGALLPRLRRTVESMSETLAMLAFAYAKRSDALSPASAIEAALAWFKATASPAYHDAGAHLEQRTFGENTGLHFTLNCLVRGGVDWEAFPFGKLPHQSEHVIA